MSKYSSIEGKRMKNTIDHGLSTKLTYESNLLGVVFNSKDASKRMKNLKQPLSSTNS
jgi:hypothetical protein